MDMIVNQRIFCSLWENLNDPLEGYYRMQFGEEFSSLENMYKLVLNQYKDTTHICSLSNTGENYLLWSHYANGHRGVAIEIDIDRNLEQLHEVKYEKLNPIFGEKFKETLPIAIFTTKTKQWKYEKEYRILFSGEFYKLPSPISRILLGPCIDSSRKEILKSLMPNHIQLVETKIDKETGNIKALTMKDRS